jgi:hypothetical protein
MEEAWPASMLPKADPRYVVSGTEDKVLLPACVDGQVHGRLPAPSAAREEIKASLALQREGLRTPPPAPPKEALHEKAEETFKKWMVEWLAQVRLEHATLRVPPRPTTLPAQP